MLKNMGIIMVAMSFIILIMMVGELFLVRLEIQGAFDRATRIAADQTVDQNSPDLPIDSDEARDVFLDVLQKNLKLDTANGANNGQQRLRQVTIQSFTVANVTSETSFSATNPITGTVVTGSISRPSVITMGVARIHLAFWPTDIQLPILSVSGGTRPL